MKRLDFLVFTLGALLFIINTSELAAGGKSDVPSWTEHLDIIIPAIRQTAWITVQAVGGLLALIGALAGIVWRRWNNDRKKEYRAVVNKIESMDTKLTALVEVIGGCEGCAPSIKKYGRRKEDLKILDSEDILHPHNVLEA